MPRTDFDSVQIRKMLIEAKYLVYTEKNRLIVGELLYPSRQFRTIIWSLCWRPSCFQNQIWSSIALGVLIYLTIISVDHLSYHFPFPAVRFAQGSSLCRPIRIMLLGTLSRSCFHLKLDVKIFFFFVFHKEVHVLAIIYVSKYYFSHITDIEPDRESNIPHSFLKISRDCSNKILQSTW